MAEGSRQEAEVGGANTSAFCPQTSAVQNLVYENPYLHFS